ncbi:TPA: VPA1267 family protein [Photobacterium damselae]
MSEIVKEVPSSQADESLAKFLSWKATQSPVDVASMSRGSKLNRVEVSKRVGIAKSTLNDNHLVKAALLEWEGELRDKKQLAPLKKAPKGFNHEDSESIFEAKDGYIPYDQSIKRLKFLSAEVERLKRKNLEMDAEISRLRKKLQTYEELSEVLSSTGVLPR